VAVVTEAQRVHRINQLLGELSKMPPDKQHATIEIPGPGGQPLFCKVITIGVDEVVLNPSSHRVRAQLEDDPEWPNHQADPFGQGAQRIIQRLVRESRSPKEFAALKESLAKDGQTEPGVITSKGVLINANTRAVAMRELDDPAKRYIRVAVLPDTMQPDELSLLELHLQMRKEHKAAYSFTNELLFIEELSVKRHMSNAQIAAELDIEVSNQNKGAKVIQDRLTYLDLIRTLQQLPKDGLRLTFFDDVSYQHLEDLYSRYGAVADSDAAEATRILEAFLLSVAVGVTPVHQLRKIDPDFIPQYMLPQLEDDEMIGAHAAHLATITTDGGKTVPSGVGALLSEPVNEDEPEVNVRGLINVVTQRGHKVAVPGTNIVLERDDVKEALKTAIISGVKEKGRDTSASNKLLAPLDRMLQASQAVKKCQEACHGVVATDEFGDSKRKTLEVKFKQLRKYVDALEADLVKAGVTTKKRT
jgi:hypothetical protein